MQKRSGKKDFAQNALRVVEISIGEPLVEPAKVDSKPEKNAAAVALGRLGGLKGGKARAAKLTDSQRREIASKAARKRLLQFLPGASELARNPGNGKRSGASRLED
jgi:hypothetical protein